MVAFVLVQYNVAPWPLVIVEGDAVSVTVGTIDPDVTVTVVLAVWVPPGPVAVAV